MDRWNPARFGIEVRDYFHFDKFGHTPGTYWYHPDFDCWLTADHVYRDQKGDQPYFTNGSAKSGAGLIDAAIIGTIRLDTPRPREPRDEEAVRIFGSPQGSGLISERRGRLRFRMPDPRAGYTIPEWWGLIENRPSPVPHYDGLSGVVYQPVSTGMSGGVVLAKDGPLGILVTSAPPYDYNNDGEVDQAFTFVALSDVYDVFSERSVGQV